MPVSLAGAGTKTGTSIPRYSASGFNYSPSPATGTNAYGYIPGQIGAPNPAGDLSAVYPNLTPQNAQISSNIMSELRGDLSPEAINSIRDQAANFGVSSGMPGSQLASYGGLRNLGIATHEMQRRGLQDYLAATSGIKGTQTVDPALQFQIAETNAINAAAPDPTLAAQEQLKLFDKYMERLTSAQQGGGGSGGGKNSKRIETWLGDQLVNYFDPDVGFVKGPGAAAYYR